MNEASVESNGVAWPPPENVAPLMVSQANITSLPVETIAPSCQGWRTVLPLLASLPAAHARCAGPGICRKSSVNKYGDWLYQRDWITGQVLDALDRHGLTANILVIATSDNGAAGRAYALLRASKSSIYEGRHREPFDF